MPYQALPPSDLHQPVRRLLRECLAAREESRLLRAESDRLRCELHELTLISQHRLALARMELRTRQEADLDGWTRP